MIKVILFFLFILTAWININLLQSSHYEQKTVNDYFFVPNNTKSIFSNNSREFVIIHDAIKIVNNMVCQKNIRIENNSTFEFNICEDNNGRLLQKIEKKRYTIFTEKDGKIKFYSMKLSDSTSHLECKSSFATNIIFGLSRKTLSLSCDKHIYKFAKGIGLFYYKNNNKNAIQLKKLTINKK